MTGSLAGEGRTDLPYVSTTPTEPLLPYAPFEISLRKPYDVYRLYNHADAAQRLGGILRAEATTGSIRVRVFISLLSKPSRPIDLMITAYDAQLLP